MDDRREYQRQVVKSQAVTVNRKQERPAPYKTVTVRMEGIWISEK